MERTILVAEDSPTQAEHLRLLLEGEGYRVDLVANGREGLERVRSAPPDLIISDVVMPELDGYAFCCEVKSAERTRRIPFVLLTERNTPTDVIHGLQVGADNFITKPFEDEYLLERVRRIFQNLELRRKGHLDVEIALTAGGQQITINADKQQMIELLFSTLEELVRLNGRLAESQRIIEEYARSLEAKVRERTEQLLQTEKLATLGELIAGIAHELNNPLSSVVGHAQLLRMGEQDPKKAARAERIVEAAQRATRIVRNFLTVVRRHPAEKVAVPVNDIITKTLELLAYQIKVNDIALETTLAPDLPVIAGDPHQLQQVILNLLHNAIQAMAARSGAGRLWVTSALVPDRATIRITVADDGPGISPEHLPRLFEAFFTTKPPGKGTGLGLAIARGIVTEHGGTITVESAPGQGATFIVTLPVTAPPVARPAPAPARVIPTALGVLVVDDEPALREMMAEALVDRGARVETAASGREALEILARAPVDVVVLDVRMPEMGGTEFWTQVSRTNPALAQRTVFCTGDVVTEEVRAFLEATGCPVVSKPFELGQFFDAVARAAAR